jgi:antitoxin ParD1/3/4
MARQSISFTTPNSKWLKSKIEVEGEYSSNSELVNELVRKARRQEAELDFIRAKITQAEQSGFTDQSRETVLSEFKEDARRDGKL